MKRAPHKRAEKGFSLIEMMIAAVIFILLCGAAFALLSVAQQRYQTESQVLNSFQEARFGLDEIVRDVNGSVIHRKTLFRLTRAYPGHESLCDHASRLVPRLSQFTLPDRNGRRRDLHHARRFRFDHREGC